jgi:REP element-mobilizing transposase RayT
MALPKGYFLTWVTYGTWLHGDERGSVDSEHNVPGQDYAPPDARRTAHRTAQLKHPPTRLDDACRQIVRDTVIAHCEFRGWQVRALNVRTNHVHLVVCCGDTPAQRVLDQLKAWCTRRLREARLAGPRTEIWAEGGSKRHLWDSDSLNSAVTYVMDGQGHDLD